MFEFGKGVLDWVELRRTGAQKPHVGSGGFDQFLGAPTVMDAGVVRNHRLAGLQLRHHRLLQEGIEGRPVDRPPPPASWGPSPSRSGYRSGYGVGGGQSERFPGHIVPWAPSHIPAPCSARCPSHPQTAAGSDPGWAAAPATPPRPADPARRQSDSFLCVMPSLANARDMVASLTRTHPAPGAPRRDGRSRWPRALLHQGQRGGREFAGRPPARRRVHRSGGLEPVGPAFDRTPADTEEAGDLSQRRPVSRASRTASRRTV